MNSARNGLILCIMVALCSSALSQTMDLRVVPGMPSPDADMARWRVVVLIRSEGETARTITPEVQAEGARVLSIQPQRASVKDQGPAWFFVHMEEAQGPRPPTLTVAVKEVPGCSKTCILPIGIDLSQLAWEAWWAGKDSHLDEVRGLPPSTAEWKPIRLPKMWQELGVTWIRTRLSIPASWRDEKLSLLLKAVDDNDATYLNGKEIGRTNGWDVQRSYVLPTDGIRWGEKNELCIAVYNGNAGGGIVRTPICIVAGELPEAPDLFPPAVLQKEADRAAPGEIGPRLPFRRMAVRDGVLRYEDGKEVALWGVNCYPQSWQQYVTLKWLGVDHRRAVDEDFEDFAQMGIDIIRIHVFDTEISDGKGNLVVNDHLDILDYLIAQCNKRNIYLMLTPIAWWGSPNARPDSFSRNIPKQALSLWPETWPVQANYLRQFLTHKNPHTGRRLVDEPCLVLFEIVNEPTYWHCEQVLAGDPGKTDLNAEVSRRGIEGVRNAWEQFVPSKEWVSPTTFECFRYDTLRRYINTMIETMRQAGAHQPIASSGFFMVSSDIAQAIADSRCDAITLSRHNYPGGLKQITDDKNLLSQLDNAELDARLAAKARIVYEFDAPGTIRRVSMYPAMGRYWRNLGAQVACQFQYDARAAAHVNLDWGIHYLNLWHTPEKMVSFLIGGEVFRRLPRGATFPTPPSDQVFPPGAVSYEKNAALLCAPDCYMQARPTDWRPMALPKDPKKILSVGACPYFEYDGTGVVDLRMENGTAHLRIYPDVERLQDGIKGTVGKPLTKLRDGAHPFRIRLPVWKDAKVERHQDGQWVSVPGTASEFTATPGAYRLVR
ncbi:MAG: hypothetical protein AB1696_29320 [Planctomycetota bacterium]